jgi:putative ABC transport system permease protein
VRFPDEPIGFASAGADVWIANTLEASRTGSRGNQNLAVVGRLRSGASMTELAHDLDAVRSRFRADFPDRYASQAAKSWKVVAVPLRDQMIGAVRPVLFMLGCAVALVLLIACVNVSNLMLVRASLRRGEMAVRLALGANRGRLLRQLLTESTILCLGGGLLGVLLAWAGLDALTRLDAGSIPRLREARINGLVLAFSLAVSVLTGIIVGIVPALQQSRTDLRGAMGEGARGSSDGRSRRRFRTALVGAEVALALVILNCAALFGRSFAALQSVETGFRPHGVTSMYVTLPGRTYDSASKVTRFFERLQAHTAAIPGVTEASVVYPLPMAGDGWSGSFDVDGPPEVNAQGPHAEYAVVQPGYFHALRIPLIAGRDFDDDDKAKAPLVVIIDETLAHKYWPKQSALGKRINPGYAEGSWATVIGVVRHVRSVGPQKESEPQLYMPYAQNAQSIAYVVVRTGATTASVGSALRGAVHSIDRDLAVSRLRSMDEVVASAVARQRFNLLMLALFAGVALGLATVGLYGVMTYLVAQRTREIGIRIALGGQPYDVQRFVVQECLVIALIGLAIGTAGTLALSGALGSLLYGVRATDPLTYGVVASVLLAVALAAAYVPARRATRIDPMLALRE